MLRRMSEHDIPRYLTVREAAEYGRVSDRQIYRYRESGELPVIKIRGRVLIDRADLDALMHRHRDAAEQNDAWAAKIAEIVAQAPPLTQAQRRDLAALLAIRPEGDAA